MQTQNPIPDDGAGKRRPFLKGLVAGGLIGSLLAGGIAAFADVEHHGHGWKGECGHRHGMRDPAVMKERADFMAERMLDRVDATPEQRARVKATLQSALDELMTLREKHRANREAMITALTQPSIDRTALERIREDEMQLADKASKTLIASLADVADALEPAQRQALAEMASRWAEGHRR